MTELRVGLGYDVHAFAEGRRLVLGGIEIPHATGLAGHSDADVLVHALMDAVLGAMRAGDIGAHFPDTDPAYEGVSSLDLLTQVGGLMREAGWMLADADTVLILESPRISPYRDAMRAAMAQALGVDTDRIGLKATTTEGLGATGRGEGVAAQAVVLLERV
ncbi:MAG TPA: 2-C-methyl-D-erythritol 2,4-cyclodiphosphate synthase [Coriobacteriia bacterium]